MAGTHEMLDVLLPVVEARWGGSPIGGEGKSAGNMITNKWPII